MAKRKLNKAWLQDHLSDPYVKRAQQEGYRARAAYKLQEIDEEFNLIKPGQLVLDLGATPGAWSQYVRKKMGGGSKDGFDGTIIALDMLDFEPIANVTFIKGDFRDDTVLNKLEELMQGQQADVIVSDMAPNLSGVAAADASRISHLVELAVEFSTQHLKPEGVLVCKLFHGSGYSQLVQLFKETFKTVKPYKPKASRDRSSETFIVGLKLK